jgi:heptosyltransferase-1
LIERGLVPVLPWGTEAERQRAERIAKALPGARVPERRPLDDVAALIAAAEIVIGVDTGLLHLAAALDVPLVAIFTGSRPHLTAPVGSGPMRVLGEFGKAPDAGEVERAVSELIA